MRRRIGTVIGAGVLFLVATACAGTEQVGAGSAGGDTLTTSASASSSAPVESEPLPPQGQPVPDGGTPVPAERVDAQALAEDAPRTVWTEGDGTVVGLVGQEGGCTSVRAEITGQTAEQVGVELVETVPLEQKMCTMDLRYPPLSVTLDAPLAERKVVLTARQEQK
jgi:hypothetical protein